MKTKILVICLLVHVSSPAFSGDKTNILIGQSLDLLSSEYAFSRGAYEANPLLRDRYVRIGYKTAASALTIAACHELRKHNRKNAAKWISRIVLTIGVGITVNNVYQGRK